MSKKQNQSIGAGMMVVIAIAIGAIVMAIEWLAQYKATLIGLGIVIIIVIVIFAYVKHTGKFSETDKQ